MTAPAPQQIPYATAAGAAAHQKEVAARLGRLPPQQPVVRRSTAPAPARPQPVADRPAEVTDLPAQADAHAEIGQMFVRLIAACLRKAGEQGLSPFQLKQVIAQFASVEAPPAAVSIQLIKDVVAQRFGLKAHDLASESRRHTVVPARHIAMTLAQRLTIHHNQAIGRAFGMRDHSSVSHAIRKIEHRAAIDVQLHNTLDDLTREILAAAEVA